MSKNSHTIVRLDFHRAVEEAAGPAQNGRGDKKLFIKKGLVDRNIAIQSNALLSILVSQDLILCFVLAIFPFLFSATRTGCSR